MLFRITETDAEIEARIKKWDKYLEQEDEEKEKKKQERKKNQGKKPKKELEEDVRRKEI